jgi:hypothetical protein
MLYFVLFDLFFCMFCKKQQNIMILSRNGQKVKKSVLSSGKTCTSGYQTTAQPKAAAAGLHSHKRRASSGCGEILLLDDGLQDPVACLIRMWRDPVFSNCEQDETGTRRSR